MPSSVEEIIDEPAHRLCIINAELKAMDVSLRYPADVVLGADTIVVLDGTVYGKPASMDHAREMLGLLSGRVHEVLTGVCLLRKSTGEAMRFTEATRVKFRTLDPETIDAYLEAIHPLDKAGAYAAQQEEPSVIEQVEGSFTNVVGLPMERLTVALERFDIRPTVI